MPDLSFKVIRFRGTTCQPVGPFHEDMTSALLWIGEDKEKEIGDQFWIVKLVYQGEIKLALEGTTYGKAYRAEGAVHPIRRGEEAP